MRVFRLCLAVLLCGLFLELAAPPIEAHHSVVAEFDVNRNISVSGTLTKIDWILPHSWLYVDVKGPNGKIQKWSFLLPSTFRRQGANKGYFMIGETLKITGVPARGVPLRGYVTDVKLPDGRILSMAGQL